MPTDPRKRQKKLAKQKAKKKAEKQAIARRESQGFAPRFLAAASAPILHCCVQEEFWQAGIGQILISRSMPNGNVAFAVFLVDVYCLGVKDVYSGIKPRLEYEEKLYNNFRDRFVLTNVKPEYARKLIEGAVQYADASGLTPHSEYRVAKLIFGDISAETCAEEFVYGKDGKPFFISGPNDDMYRCRDILKRMESRLGPDGYHYTLMLDESSPIWDDIEIGEDSIQAIDEDDAENPTPNVPKK
jgi:hypothetical protein